MRTPSATTPAEEAPLQSNVDAAPSDYAVATSTTSNNEESLSAKLNAARENPSSQPQAPLPLKKHHLRRASSQLHQHTMFPLQSSILQTMHPFLPLPHCTHQYKPIKSPSTRPFHPLLHPQPSALPISPHSPHPTQTKPPPPTSAQLAQFTA